MSMSDKRTDFLIRYAHDFAPFIVARASGSWIETTAGQRILDFTSGQICSTIGHNHPQLVAAVQRSLEEVIHLIPGCCLNLSWRLLKGLSDWSARSSIR